MPYDDLYRTNPDYFGIKPSRILVDYCHLIDKSKPVLDIGAGQGRHALYLARRGFTVDAIDRSVVAMETLSAAAVRDNLPITATHSSFEDLKASDTHYSAILLFGIIQEQDRANIGFLVDKVRVWLMNRGLVFITAFTLEDPSYERFRTGREIDRNSYVNANGVTRTFIEENEILRLFAGFEAIHHWEGLGPVHQHGDKPPERHGTVQAVLRKP